MEKADISGSDILSAAIKAGRKLEDDFSLDTGFKTASDQAGVLADYLSLLVKWNKSMNLVGPHNWDEIFHSLIIDSLHLADFLNILDLPREPVTFDLGAGAGLPGLPLRVLWQKGFYYLVEVRQKRSIFMRTALRSVRLPRTEVFEGRAEDIPQEAQPADLILSKAFMPWKELLFFSRPLIAGQGRIVILSNDAAPDSTEIIDSGFRIESVKKYNAGGKVHYFWSLLPAS